MLTRKPKKPAGSMLDLTHLMTLPSDDCNLLIVSSRTLYAIQHYGNKEVNWYARYYIDRQENGDYQIVSRETIEAENVDEIARNYRNEVEDMSCDIVGALNGIKLEIGKLSTALSIQQSWSLCCPEGTSTEPPAGTVDGTDTPIGPGEEYETVEEYLDVKCNMANFIVDDLTAMMTEFSIKDIQDFASGSVAIGWAGVAGIIGAFWIGAAAAAVIGAIGAIVALVLGPVLFDIADLVTVLNAKKDALIQALYCANSNSDARVDFLAELEGEGLTALEIEFVSLFLNDNVLSVLFVPAGPGIDYVGTYECEPCENSGLWMFAPVAFFSDTWDFGSNIFAGAGVITDDGSNFTLESVSFVDTIDGLTKHIISLCTVEFYQRWLELGQPKANDFPTSAGPVCISTPGLEVVGSQPSSASINWRNCIGGQWSAAGAAIFAPNPNPNLIFFSQHRFTGGAFTETFRVPI